MLRPGVLIACLALATPALAAGPTPLREVERGFSVGTDFGFVDWLRLPGSSSASGSGALVGVNLGVDAGPLRIGIVGWGQSVGAGADFQGVTGAGDTHHARGDFETLFAGGDVRLRLLSLPDFQDVDRTSIYLRAAFGPTLSRPIGVLDQHGLMAAAGAGLSYETRLRHFAVGLEALGLWHKQDAGTGTGLAILPTLRYTF